MFNLERSGLSQKLTIISVLSTGSALLLVFVAFAATSVLSQTEDERKQLSSLAAIVGNNIKPALRDDDRKQAEQTLATLVNEDDILQAALYDEDGKLLARYTSPGLPSGQEAPGDLDAADLAADTRSVQSGAPWAPAMRLYRGVRVKDRLVGVVMLESAQTRMWLDILKNLGAAAVAAVLSFMTALLTAARSKSSAAEPLGTLIAAAQQVSRGQPTPRILHQRGDELGALIDSFNDMLAQVEGRDAALAQYRDQLERQVGVRTEQLEKAKNAAEAASRAKSAFLATMSHEIRTPMNGVLGMTELLLATRLSEQQRHYTEMVKRSGEHLLVIINDILDFSKIEAGKLTVEYIHFNFRDLLDDIDNVFSPQAPAKGIRLELAVANDHPAGHLRRSQPAAPGHVQPAGQRDQVHRERQDHRQGRRGARGRAKRRPALRGARHRHRRLERGAGPHLRLVLAGRRLDHAQARRHRPGAGDLQATGRADGRHDRGRSCFNSRIDLLVCRKFR
jgi:two-component system sensor histidine kinase/response regulator